MLATISARIRDCVSRNLDVFTCSGLMGLLLGLSLISSY